MTKSLPELLPFPIERFYDEFKGKKYFIVKSKKPIFSNHLVGVN